ncbi:MAG TPA: glycosyltransferase [Candidatus Paceibacterota bacterium]
MSLLFITQRMDKGDSTLGFVHAWVSGFSKQFKTITVICLQEGAYSLPPNVHVFSLGKENGRTFTPVGSVLPRSTVGRSRIRYIKNFFTYIWRERNNYDAVLVHMNQEYVLLGGLLWKLLGKRIFMWRNHYAGSVLTAIAAAFCTKIFCTSKASYTAKYKKTVLMPVGVDMELYRPAGAVARIPRSILFYARIAPSKRPHMLLEALKDLHAKGVAFTASFYGSPLPNDIAYHEGLKRTVQDIGLSRQVRFAAGLPYLEGPQVFSAHDIFVNLSPSGMYDKTLFEAAGCECLVLACSADFARLMDKQFSLPVNGERGKGVGEKALSPQRRAASPRALRTEEFSKEPKPNASSARFSFAQDDKEELALKLQELLNLGDAEKLALRATMREVGLKEHSLSALAHRLKVELSR